MYFADQPLRELCGTGLTPRIIGSSRTYRESSASSYVGQRMTALMMPTHSVAVAIMSDALGVKSAVTSTRLPRGRTPMPVERRLAASSITGVGRMYVSNSASLPTLQCAARSRSCVLKETL